MQYFKILQYLLQYFDIFPYSCRFFDTCNTYYVTLFLYSTNSNILIYSNIRNEHTLFKPVSLRKFASWILEIKNCTYLHQLRKPSITLALIMHSEGLELVTATGIMVQSTTTTSMSVILNIMYTPILQIFLKYFNIISNFNYEKIIILLIHIICIICVIIHYFFYSLIIARGFSILFIGTVREINSCECS